MTEETLVRKFKAAFDDLYPALGNGLSYNDFRDELAEKVRELLRRAWKEGLKGKLI